MFVVANRLLNSGSRSSRLSTLLTKESRCSFQKGSWPEALTQQTLKQFLEDINYFQEPRDIKNIGLSLPNIANKDLDTKKTDRSMARKNSANIDVDHLVELLGKEEELPALDMDNAQVDPRQLGQLAIDQCIYRDIFDRSVPIDDNINFTAEQAQRLDRLIPNNWITDLPHSRVKRIKNKEEPLLYFEPLIGISASFPNEQKDDSSYSHYAHNVYHGNIIPAAEALTKPAISLDGRWLQKDPYSPSLLQPSQDINWEPGTINLRNFPTDSQQYYSICLLNLDSVHIDTPNLHWFIANISTRSSQQSEYEEICDYLPVHGIRGYGHSRYVFLLLQHNSKLDHESLRLKDGSLESRKFDAKKLLEQNSTHGLVPVGLSWFQTQWDESSNDVFHKNLNMRAPVYEMIPPKFIPVEAEKNPYPGKIPFNIYLDHLRTKKDIDQQVLLERLKNIDPFDYKDQYEPPKVPPTVFDEEEPHPSWMSTVLLKKKFKVGYWRGLRPASALLPLNNNADLESPIRPFLTSKKNLPNYHNKYQGKPVLKHIKDLPYSKPVNEHQSVYIYEGSEIYVDEVKSKYKLK